MPAILVELCKNRHDPVVALEYMSKVLGTSADVSIGSDVEVLWMNIFSGLDSTKYTSFYPADNLFVHNGVFGTDGRSLQGEWRIPPAFDVQVFIDNTIKSMELCKKYTIIAQQRSRGIKGSRAIPNVYPFGLGVYSVIKANEMDLPEAIGLHIHFGNKRLKATKESRLLIAALDLLLYPITKVFESESAHVIRTLTSWYGALSALEDKPYGIEYKALPSVIDNKVVYTGVFAIAKTIAVSILDGSFPTWILNEMSIKEGYIHNKSYLQNLIKASWKILKYSCPMYHLYQDEIDALFKLALEKNPSKYFETYEDIFSYWGITVNNINTVLNKALEEGKVLQPVNTPIKGYTHAKVKTRRALTVNPSELVFY